MDGEDEGLLTGLRGYKKGWGENYIIFYVMIHLYQTLQINILIASYDAMRPVCMIKRTNVKLSCRK